MFTVALIGGDGAGKTTVAQHLVKSLPWPVKYLYMGLSTLSSNKALPTSLLARFLKLRAYQKSIQKSGKLPSSHDLHYGAIERGPLWITARFLNRLAEAWWRQLLSLSYQLRGYVVIYDRYFLFETAPDIHSETKKQKLLDRLEYKILNNYYPRPDLVIFLDASPEVLYGRKGEATLQYLEKRRGTILELGKHIPNFVNVDASQPLEYVLADVTQHILDFYTYRSLKKDRNIQ
jgi:thymidylate kinase